MVQEYRRIILDEDELRSAFEAYRRMRPQALPAGKITHCAASQHGAEAATVTLTIEPPDAGHGPSTQHLLTEAAILEPVIRFCIENNIVLPRNGRKTVGVVGGKVSLCVALNLSLGLGLGVTEPQTKQHIVALQSITHETILKSVGAR
jgi:hypothetical protein